MRSILLQWNPSAEEPPSERRLAALSPLGGAPLGSIQQQNQIPRFSWLSKGIASPGNFALLLATFALFPFVARWTDAFAFGSIGLDSPHHTRAIVKFCLLLLVFEWSWFFIAWFGIRRFGRVTFAQVVGGRWNRASKVFLDMGIALGVLVLLLLLGTLLQQFLSRFESSAAPLRSMVPQNVFEASAYLAAALTAGFVEEFVFRGYLQKQLTAWTGAWCWVQPCRFCCSSRGTISKG
jgi:membrane protease YdiL (CAAX protease family)